MHWRHGFKLPEGISTSGTLLTWLEGKSRFALRRMDRGDPLDPASIEARPKDRSLSRVEIFNAILDDYQLATKKSLRAGLKGNWTIWERYQKERDTLAQSIQELGWHPVFHIADRDYQRRMVALIKQEAPRDLAALQRLFLRALPNWAQGGLCFGYPPGFKESWREFTAEETVTACKSHDLANWGECNGATRKVLALMTAALSIYSKPPKLEWWLIQKLPNSSRGHSFLALEQKNNRVALDPSPFGFSAQSMAVYLKQVPYRAAIATYYSNLALAPGMEGKYAEKDQLYRKAVEINPRYDLGWNNLGWVQLKLGKPELARGYFLRALEINPRHELARSNLRQLGEK